jgi:hypothetical protein
MLAESRDNKVSSRQISYAAIKVLMGGVAYAAWN